MLNNLPPFMMNGVIVVLLVIHCSTLAHAQKFDVKIINRQDSDQTYNYATYHWGIATGTTFRVSGAALTLRLPDGRIAVVNCTSKYAPHFDYINQRSCRMPLVDEIQAEFKSDSAKLSWSVSLDGKKRQSETYRVLAIMANIEPEPLDRSALIARLNQSFVTEKVAGYVEIVGNELRIHSERASITRFHMVLSDKRVIEAYRRSGITDVLYTNDADQVMRYDLATEQVQMLTAPAATTPPEATEPASTVSAPPATVIAPPGNQSPPSVDGTAVSKDDNRPAIAAASQTVRDPGTLANSSAGLVEESLIGVWFTGNPTVRHDGVEISGVQPKGPADNIEIRAGDVILAIDGHYLYTIDELRAQLLLHKPGERLVIRYRRDRLTSENNLTLASKDAAPSARN